MLAALKRHGMILTAYCPMARGKLLDDPVVGAIAKAHGKTIGQICLRWLIQQPMVAAVPRPLEEAHIEEDLDVFDWSLSDGRDAADFGVAQPPRPHRRSARARAQVGRRDGRLEERLRALDQLVEPRLVRIARLAGMDDRDLAALGGFHELRDRCRRSDSLM